MHHAWTLAIQLRADCASSLARRLKCMHHWIEPCVQQEAIHTQQTRLGNLWPTAAKQVLFQKQAMHHSLATDGCRLCISVGVIYTWPDPKECSHGPSSAVFDTTIFHGNGSERMAIVGTEMCIGHILRILKTNPPRGPLSLRLDHDRDSIVSNTSAASYAHGCHPDSYCSVN